MIKYVKKQESISDCGACCLFSIIKYYNGYVPLEIIKMDTLTDNNGTTFYNIKQAAIKYGFECFGINNKKIDLKPPFMVQFKLPNGLYHFVVVYEINSDNYICMDPSVGIKKYLKNEFDSLFTGNILKIKPINSVVRYKQNKHLVNLIKKLNKNNFKKIILLFVLSIIIIGFSIINTALIKVIINNSSLYLIIIFICFLFFKNILYYAKNYLLAHLNKIYSNNLIYDYISYYFFLPFKYLQLKNIGEITSKINDLKNVKEILSKDVVNVILSCICILSSIIIFFVLNKLIMYCLLVLSIIIIFIMCIVSKKSYCLYSSAMDEESNFNNYLIEYLNKIFTIKNMSKEKFFLNRIFNCLNDSNSSYFNLEIYMNNINFLMNIYNDLGLFIIIIISVLTKESVDDILLFILYYNYFVENINYILSILPNLEYFRSLFDKVNGVYYIDQDDFSKGIDLKNDDLIINNLNYNINFNNIIYKLNINIRKNSKVLLIGKNGSGKSTLLNCLNGNYDNYLGNIYIGNNSLDGINKKSLKEGICLSYQDDSLFLDTIKNNIILDKDYDDKKFTLICKVLYLERLIEKKGGVNSLINNNVSGGEKQRIILARCLYQGANILLLDESLSEINYNLRIKIINNINKYFKNKTIIYVSHFLEKYRFDQIIDLTDRKENGEYAK